jgi:carbamoyl-phosphate synthase small subunit
VHELSKVANHWNLSLTLDEWLYNEKIPGISGIDTRELTKKLRVNGVMMAALAVSEKELNESDLRNKLESAQKYVTEEFMNSVSTKEPKIYGKESNAVVVIDTGVKNAILRNIRKIGYKVIQLPWNSSIDKILSYKPKGVVISNGPGDPQKCTESMKTTKELLNKNIPTLGICLGAQIMGLAGGADTFKLKYGHRGQNKSCINLDNNRVYVTSQNHGYGIDPNSLKKSEYKLWFSNADDQTVEGIKHKEKKFIAVQFHPEASPGPFDCKFIFEELKRLMEEEKTAKR